MELDEIDVEQVVTIPEFLDSVEARQLEADLVLGGDEGNECTYEKGYMKRQAVFSCLTCTPGGNAGFCTACSLTCHDGHEVVELWTRRGFRCDCGNEKFGPVECKLRKEKEPLNKGNMYNQNYRGLYCSCHRPFPDPEGSDQGEMLQCCICEDWFHESHLGLSSSQQVPRDDDGEPSFDELICPSCVDRCNFISQYPDLLVPPLEVDEDLPSPSGDVVSKVDSEVLAVPSSLDGLPSEGSSEASASKRDSSITAPEGAGTVKPQTSGKGNVETAIGESSKGETVVCKLKPSFDTGASDHEANGLSTSKDVETDAGTQLKTGEAIFLAKSWRTELCRCDACVAMYAAKEMGFLLDNEDTLQVYEETAKKKRQEVQVKEEGITSAFMKNLGHVQKMEFFHGVNDMANGLQSYLAPFGESGKTVTSADIYDFFEKLQQKRRRFQ